jgi:ATP-binding cassette, subfamily B, bacterial
VTIPLDATWPPDEIERALRALAREAGLPVRSVGPRPAGTGVDADEASRSVELTADWLGLEAEAVDGTYAEIDRVVRGAGPALLRLEIEGRVQLAALVRAGRFRASLAGPHGARRVSTAALGSTLRRPLEAPFATAVDRTLQRARVPKGGLSRARAGLMLERASARRFHGCWILRRPASAPFLDQLRAAGSVFDAAVLVAAHVVQYVLGLTAWWCLGRGALEGHLDRGWLLAWAALLVSQVPFRVLELRAQGRITIEAAALLKRRLFQGSIALAPEEMRGEGAGQLLGRTLEASAVESLAATSGLAAILTSVDLVVAGAVLAFGAGGLLSTAALAAWVVLGAFVARRYTAQRRAWTDERLTLTHGLVERMIGHRTRVAQEPREEWHTGEDAEISSYLGSSRALDRTSVLLTAVLPAGWLVLGLATIGPALLAGTTSTTSVAIAIAGVMLAFLAMRKLGEGIRNAATVVIAWSRIALLFAAGGRSEPAPPPEPARRHGEGRMPDQPLMVASDLVFRYRPGGEPVLRNCSVRVAARDRLLLEGPSGGGKSTLSLLLAGVRAPEAGTLLLDGLDRHTLGSGEWRRRVVTVPQFHENHVFSSTFAFNLLMGRGWPPRGEDIEEAELVCRELGLGELLARMPAGLQQIVGETGWQLSHGERSRLYVARALLQSPALLVLDESFAALDPETMKVAMECVLRRSQALVVVAHP